MLSDSHTKNEAFSLSTRRLQMKPRKRHNHRFEEDNMQSLESVGRVRILKLRL
ncbi:hypothetical protein PCANC_17336 [Puccinia coronata f. sp. avenae]|uniref:Uncharacterized protein n=1 Tax=Puccinia coronata f. sp. avenae TaxID=200324 RepID=A0A2N5UU95_9BASI|nr:hypothetical protein PCANC_17336 [Puccinia coronata f. sp. avenae]